MQEVHATAAHRVASILESAASDSPASSARLLPVPTAFGRFGSQLRLLERQAEPPVAITFSPVWAEALPPAQAYKRRLLLVHESDRLRATLSLRERMVAGLPTGILHGGDAKAEGLLLCPAGEERRWLLAGLLYLFASRRCTALLLDRSLAAAAQLDGMQPQLAAAGLRMWSREVPFFWRTALCADFNETLSAFGHRTRRNLRHALRRVEANGWQFVPQLNAAEAVEATSALAGRATHPYSKSVVAARLALESSQSGGFSMGIRGRSGEWLSVLTGARRTDATTDIFWQANAPHAQESLALSMRALLMKHEGPRGTCSLRFVGGTSPLLEHCCQPDPGVEILITRPSVRLWMLRRALRTRWASPQNPLRVMLGQ